MLLFLYKQKEVKEMDLLEVKNISKTYGNGEAAGPCFEGREIFRAQRGVCGGGR